MAPVPPIEVAITYTTYGYPPFFGPSAAPKIGWVEKPPLAAPVREVLEQALAGSRHWAARDAAEIESLEAELARVRERKKAADEQVLAFEHALSD